MWDDETTRHFQKNLLGWYRKHRRALPWRADQTPYKVWISEIMLQQTQTRSVLHYYDSFLKMFPNVESLAQASQQQVLEVWSGLGYYRRALNLHKAARRILEVHKTFPEDFSAILSLPGIGRYTAGAICSIAFNKAYPIVDGNIRRVVTRLHGKRGRIPESYFWKTMSALVPDRAPSDFNQGMMELGALVCVPFKPQCLRCPVQIFCKAKRLGMERSIPCVPTKKASTRIRIAILVLEQNHNIFLSAPGGHSFIPGIGSFPGSSCRIRNCRKWWRPVCAERFLGKISSSGAASRSAIAFPTAGSPVLGFMEKWNRRFQERGPRVFVGSIVLHSKRA